MLHAQLLKVFLLLFSLTFSSTSFARKHETGFLDRSISMNGEVYRYQVYVPRNFDTRKRWPVVLFLHGSGERGDDGILATDGGIAHAIRTDPSRFPIVVVIPQCRKEKRWVDPDMQAQALAALDQSVREFHGDQDRLYLTGLSMGGHGTWKIAATIPRKFAAYVPICGSLPTDAKPAKTVANMAIELDSYAQTAKAIGATPVWIFHGAVDRSVPVEESRKMAEALRAAKANVRYTEYPEVGHNSWDRAYAEPELIPWMLSQKLSH